VRVKLAAAFVGAVFGVTLCWSGLTDPGVIRRGLLFEESYLFLFFAAALAVAFAGTQVLRLTRPRAVLTGDRVEVTREAPDRARLGGAVLFGAGWAIAGACPGPVVAQVGQGVVWSLFTLAGVVVGIVVFLRLERGPRSRPRRVAGSTAAAQAAP
jgi:uncharacterized protein